MRLESAGPIERRHHAPEAARPPGRDTPVRELFRSLAAERGAPVLLATHDLHEAAARSSQVVILEQGRVIARHTGDTDARRLGEAPV